MMTNKFFLVNHIQPDLQAIGSLLKEKSKQPIFVDVHAIDILSAQNCMSFLKENLDGESASFCQTIVTEEQLEQEIRKNSCESLPKKEMDSELDDLSQLPIFEFMNGEIIRLKSYGFLLDGYEKFKGLMANPFTLLLVNRWRLIVHVLFLALTIWLYQDLPQNPFFQYFLGQQRGLYKLIWIPYFIRLAFDLRYLGRLNLLMKEIVSRRKNERFYEKIKSFPRVYILSGAVFCKEAFLEICVRKNIHVLQCTYEQKYFNAACFRFVIPNMKHSEALSYLRWVCGVPLQEFSKKPLLQESIIKPLNERDMFFLKEKGFLNDVNSRDIWAFSICFHYLNYLHSPSKDACQEILYLLAVKHLKPLDWPNLKTKLEDSRRKEKAEIIGIKKGDEKEQNMSLRQMVYDLISPYMQ